MTWKEETKLPGQLQVSRDLRIHALVVANPGICTVVCALVPRCFVLFVTSWKNGYRVKNKSWCYKSRCIVALWIEITYEGPQKNKHCKCHSFSHPLSRLFSNHCFELLTYFYSQPLLCTFAEYTAGMSALEDTWKNSRKTRLSCSMCALAWMAQGLKSRPGGLCDSQVHWAVCNCWVGGTEIIGGRRVKLEVCGQAWSHLQMGMGGSKLQMNRWRRWRRRKRRRKQSFGTGKKKYYFFELIISDVRRVLSLKRCTASNCQLAATKAGSFLTYVAEFWMQLTFALCHAKISTYLQAIDSWQLV